MSRSRSHLLRRGMSVAECNKLLGPNWTDEKYDHGRGLHRIYEAIQTSGMIGADLYFRSGRLTKWWGQVEEVAAHRAAEKQRSRWRAV